jgi:hypothetical protein
VIQTCAISGISFEISEVDLTFYQRIGVPVPTLCPQERERRRLAWGNQVNLYFRKCAATGKRIISNYSPDKDVTVFDIPFWWSDGWDQYATGREFDFSREFFPQFDALQKIAPRPALNKAFEYDINSDYTHHAGNNRNCYLIFDSDECEDCYYSYGIHACVNCIDCFRCNKATLCYECIDCVSCYECFYSQDCSACASSMFLKSCIGCTDCFACVNLRNKKYHILNTPYSKEDYFSLISRYDTSNLLTMNRLTHEFERFSLGFPTRYCQGVFNEDVTGNYLVQCKKSQFCFDSYKLWDCKFVVQAFDDLKDSYDCSEVGDASELVYESIYCGAPAHNLRFCGYCYPGASNLTYCIFCVHCSDCFGCFGLRNARYCILNRQYSKDDYRQLVSRIISHMERTREWGEFFPAKLSPFAYNETHAFEYLPLSEAEARKRGLSWIDEDIRDSAGERREDCKNYSSLPPRSLDVTFDQLQHPLKCAQTGLPYRVIRQEFKFLQEHKLPIPNMHWKPRHKARLAKRAPRKLFDRNCADCNVALKTSYSVERATQVMCEACFNRRSE